MGQNLYSDTELDQYARKGIQTPKSPRNGGLLLGTGNPFLEADCMLCECVSKKTAEKEDVGDAKNCDESCKTHVGSPCV